MSRTVITFRVLAGVPLGAPPQITFSVEAPGENLPEVTDAFLAVDTDLLDAVSQLTAYRSDPASITDVVRNAGGALYGSLLKHMNATHALTRTIQAANGTSERQIRLRIPGIAASAQNLPWELLHAPTSGFLELSNRIPVVREIEAKSRPRTPDGLLTDAGLRIFSVIAAQGVSGRGEWKAISKATAEFGKPFQLRVLVGDEALKNEIVDEAGLNERISVELVPGNKLDLLNDIRSFRPQICHLFCHGRSSSGGYLEIENSGTVFGGNPHILMASDLEDVLPGSAWLVLLNACLGAQADPGSGTSALSASLIKEGVPIVVAMREEVPADIVGRFTAAFLTDALHTIAQIAEKGSEAELDLSACLTRARATICDNYPGVGPIPTNEIGARVKEWALPVMSVSKNGFRLIPKSGVYIDQIEVAGLRGELDSLNRLKELMNDALTEPQRATIEQKIRQLQDRLVALIAA
ncbi:CHAT domain-containing protein [Rhizobium leguminosarum]|uniref:CHAT domain-containing protein n=1 Tax=Rhizobium leguminosarum TaxID=384 RepID=UPI0013DAB3D5|nr:CHAT domain-containing protein [Rhizobium leguminosarum]NEK35618.1 CHAT domain-containing protein [Rhizobium leguminosarum]